MLVMIISNTGISSATKKNISRKYLQCRWGHVLSLLHHDSIITCQHGTQIPDGNPHFWNSTSGQVSKLQKCNLKKYVSIHLSPVSQYFRLIHTHWLGMRIKTDTVNKFGILLLGTWQICWLKIEMFFLSHVIHHIRAHIFIIRFFFHVIWQLVLKKYTAAVLEL